MEMETLIKDTIAIMPKVNDLVEGTVIGQEGSILFVDLSPFRTGVIYGREFNNARDLIKSLRKGDKITAKVLDLEAYHGYVDLSLKEARMDIIWREAETIQKNKTPISLLVLDANKGGLVMAWKGISGFLPASQLKMEHYPRIADGDKDAIETELKKLVGLKINVVILNHDQKEQKLIFSEKGTEAEELKEKILQYNVGDIIEGEITGIVDFGVFIKIDENLEGLAHISELDWSLVSNPAELFKVGEKVKAQIINITNGKISLSIKALKIDPWVEVKSKYKKDDIVNGVVIKYNKHGALVSIEEGVAGLVHISEFKDENDMKTKYELGKSYPFKITLFEAKEHRLILSGDTEIKKGEKE